MPTELSFTTLTPDDATEVTLFVTHPSGRCIVRPESDLVRRCAPHGAYAVDAVALRQDLEETYGPSCVTVIELFRALARLFPGREVNVEDVHSPWTRETFRSPDTLVELVSGRLYGWCERCGVANFGQFMAMFGVEGVRHRTMFHHGCLLESGREHAGQDAEAADTGPAVNGAWSACVANVREHRWPYVLPPTRACLARLLDGVFPEISASATIV